MRAIGNPVGSGRGFGHSAEPSGLYLAQSPTDQTLPGCLVDRSRWRPPSSPPLQLASRRPFRTEQARSWADRRRLDAARVNRDDGRPPGGPIRTSTRVRVLISRNLFVTNSTRGPRPQLAPRLAAAWVLIGLGLATAPISASASASEIGADAAAIRVDDHDCPCGMHCRGACCCAGKSAVESGRHENPPIEKSEAVRSDAPP